MATNAFTYAVKLSDGLIKLTDVPEHLRERVQRSAAALGTKSKDARHRKNWTVC